MHRAAYVAKPKRVKVRGHHAYYKNHARYRHCNYRSL